MIEQTEIEKAFQLVAMYEEGSIKDCKEATDIFQAIAEKLGIYILDALTTRA